MRKQKASDIDDDLIYAVVDRAKYPILGQNRWEIVDALFEFHPKVVQAKLRQMVNKGRLKGCACGCRGDFRRNPVLH